jgi:hypothetical protein
MNCFYHHTVTARYSCTSCSKELCEACIDAAAGKCYSCSILRSESAAGSNKNYRQLARLSLAASMIANLMLVLGIEELVKNFLKNDLYVGFLGIFMILEFFAFISGVLSFKHSKLASISITVSVVIPLVIVLTCLV